MWNHAPDGLEKNLRWCTVMERTRFAWVYDMSFMKKVMITQLRVNITLEWNYDTQITYLIAEKATTDVNLLAANDDNLLT